MKITDEILAKITKKYYNFLPKEKKALVEKTEKEALNLITKIICNVHHITNVNIHHLAEDLESRGVYNTHVLYNSNLNLPALIFIYLLDPSSLTSEELRALNNLPSNIIPGFRVYLGFDHPGNADRFSAYLNQINASLNRAYDNILAANDYPQTILDQFSNSLEQILSDVLPHHTYFDNQIWHTAEEIVRLHFPTAATEQIDAVAKALIIEIEAGENLSAWEVKEVFHIFDPLAALFSTITKSLNNNDALDIRELILNFIETNYFDNLEDNGLLIFNEDLAIAYQEVADILYFYYTRHNSSSSASYKGYSSEEINLIINYFEAPFSMLRETIQYMNGLRAEEMQEIQDSARTVVGSIDWAIEQHNYYGITPPLSDTTSTNSFTINSSYSSLPNSPTNTTLSTATSLDHIPSYAGITPIYVEAFFTYDK